MQKIYLASYKGTRAGLRGFTNRLIRLVNSSKYSHSEICIGNPFNASVDCLSAVGYDVDDSGDIVRGVRLKNMRLNPDKWDLKPMNITELDVRYFYGCHKGASYSFLGCVKSTVPFLACVNTSGWFCSMIAAHLEGYREPWRFYPALMHNVLKG